MLTYSKVVILFVISSFELFVEAQYAYLVPRCVILTVVTYCVILTVITYCEPNVSSLKPCPLTCLITQALPITNSHHYSPAPSVIGGETINALLWCTCVDAAQDREEAGQPYHDKPHQGEPFPTHQLVPTGAINHQYDREHITSSFTMLSESLVPPFIEKGLPSCFW